MLNLTLLAVRGDTLRPLAIPLTLDGQPATAATWAASVWAGCEVRCDVLAGDYDGAPVLFSLRGELAEQVVGGAPQLCAVLTIRSRNSARLRDGAVADVELYRADPADAANPLIRTIARLEFSITNDRTRDEVPA